MAIDKNKIIFSILLLVLVNALTIVTAQPSTTIYSFPQGYSIVPTEYEQLKVGEDFNFFFYLYNTSNGLKIDNSTVECNFHLANSQGQLVLEAAETYQPNGYWFTFINGSYINESGYYYYGVDCSDGLGGALSGVFEITPSGRSLYTPQAIAYLSVILFIFMLMGGVYIVNTNINYDSWHNKIIKKYENKNYIKLVLSSIGYNLMKNVFVIYYLMGLGLLLVITDLVYQASNLSLIPVMQSVLAIYAVGIIIVGIYFFGFVQEWLMNLLDDVSKDSWGVGK